MALTEVIGHISHQFGNKKVISNRISKDFITYAIQLKNLDCDSFIWKLSHVIHEKAFDMKYVEFNQVLVDIPEYVVITKIVSLIKQSQHHVLTLSFKVVKLVYLPVDIINAIILQMNEITNIRNFAASMEMDLNENSYENFCRLKCTDYPIMKYVTKRTREIMDVNPWESTYHHFLTGHHQTDDGILIMWSVLRYKDSRELYDDFVNIFKTYHLGDEKDYRKCILHSIKGSEDYAQSDKPLSYFFDVRYSDSGVPNVRLLFDIITGRTIINGVRNINLLWLLEEFIPYVTILQNKYKDINYMKYLPYDILLKYVSHMLKINKINQPFAYTMVMLELTKRNPAIMIYDII